MAVDDGRPAGPAGSLVVALAGGAARRPRLTLLLMLLLFALALWRVTKLELRTSLHELLPKNDPAVVVLREMDRRMPALSSLVVVVQGKDAAQNRRFVDELVPRLRALQSPLIDEVVAGAQEEIEFFRRQRFLYAGLADLEQAADTLEQEIARRRNPLLVDLGEDQTAALKQRLKELEKKGDALAGRFPDGYFAYPDRSLYAVVLWLRSSMLGDAAGEQTVEQIRRVADTLLRERFDGRVQVGLTGNLITQKEERDALQNDLTIATSVCVALVLLALVLFYDRLWAVPLTALPAFFGVALAMAFAERAFGYLNSSTAFMGSIIVGNGINYAIIQMARYEEERRLGRPALEAAEAAVRATWRGTALAALGAASAYGSLVITSFRGFNQFGYIGGIGMLLCWLATLTMLPALWALLDRGAGGAGGRRRQRLQLAGPLGRLVARHPGALSAAAALLTVAALAQIPGYARDPFEYDFEKLRSQRARNAEGERLSTALNPIFGRTMSPNFVLAGRPEQAEEIRRKMRERDQRLHVLGEVKTVHDYLPGDAKEQAAKLELLGRIRRLIDRNRDLVEGEDRDRLTQLRPPDALRALTPRDLPRSIRRFFTESDGTIGRPVVYQMREDVSVWDGRNQLKLAQVVQDLRLDNGERIRSSGSAMIFAGMLRAIVEEGPVVTAASLLIVVAAVFLFTRQRLGALLVLGSLLIGVLWMLGATALSGVRVNFLNFIALPITFGIGAEYAINLQQRYALEGPGKVAACVATTGSAVALCSLTTIIGYAALLVADSHALRSFGALAILGEVTCVFTGVVLLPAWLLLLERRPRGASPSATAAGPPGSA